jgi:hypothetical protein
VINEKDVETGEVILFDKNIPEFTILYRDTSENSMPCIIFTRFPRKTERIYEELL